MGRSEYPTKRGNFCWIKISHIGKFHILGKKVSLIAFRQILTKILPAAFIQLHNYDLFEKARLKSLNTKQCPAGLYPRIIRQVPPFLPKMLKHCCTHQVCTIPFPLNLYGKPWGCEKVLPNS